MPRQPVWFRRILTAHPTRKKDLSIHYAGRDFTNLVLSNYEYVEKLLSRLPGVKERLAHFQTTSESVRPKNFEYSITGDYVVYNKVLLARKRYVLRMLRTHPEIRRRFLAFAVRRHQPDKRATQITWSGRHADTDVLLKNVLSQVRLVPTSFLEVGAAFESRSELEPMLPDDIAPVRETKKFFDEQGVSMKYTAADIIHVSKGDQARFRQQGVNCLQWDYRERPLIERQGRVKQFSVIRMANVSRHQSRTEFAKTINVLLQSLEPNGILIIKNSGDGYSDEVFYQKKRIKRKWLLELVRSAK